MMRVVEKLQPQIVLEIRAWNAAAVKKKVEKRSSRGHGSVTMEPVH